MTDLLEFFAVKPKIFSKPGALPAPKKIQQGFEFKNVSFAVSGQLADDFEERELQAGAFGARSRSWAKTARARPPS